MAEEYRRNVGIPVSAVILLGSEYAVGFDDFSQLTIAWPRPLLITVQSNHVVIISERKVIWQLGPNGNYVRGENFTVFMSLLYDRLTNWITDVETTDDVPADTDIRIKANTERRSLLEASSKEAQSILSQRRSVKGDLETIVARAQDMGEFLKESELSDRKAFAETFVREIVVHPGKAVIHYAVPMPGDSHMPSEDYEGILLGSRR